MLNKVETYFMKEFKEKSGSFVVLTLLLLVPQYTLRLFVLFLLITTLLPRDVHSEKIKLMISLPFSKIDVFWISYAFLITIAVITQTIGGAFFNISPIGIGGSIFETLIFSSAYFGIAMISVSLGFGNFGVPFLILIADSFFGAIGKNWEFTYNLLESPSGFNPYSMISPVYQGNQIAAFMFAVALLITAYVLFARRGTAR